MEFPEGVMAHASPSPTLDDAARAEHRASIERFVETANALPNDLWERPLAPGKWSPAQIAEHLRMTYEAVLRERVGGVGLRQRTPWWMLPILRLRFLPMILRDGVLPRGARAPREIRPGEGPFDRASVLAAFRELGTRAEESFAQARPNDRGFTHHVFGALPAAKAIRFATVHNEHHTRQIATVAQRR